uniref:Uncharacterized protein n=1 Tax=Leersia perrieri TaxID=77586 RepID=A0A0D9WFS1_9ORYZ
MLLWRDQWLVGLSIACRWLAIYSYVGRSNITVAQGFLNHRWLEDLHSSLSLPLGPIEPDNDAARGSGCNQMENYPGLMFLNGIGL